jgi:hypothetical protein
MEIKIITHIWDNLLNSKEVIDRLIKENLENKLDWYLKKFEAKEDAEWIIEAKVNKNTRDLFDWTLQINLDWKSFRYSREDYKNLDDLINNLFTHFKEELSSK